MGFFSRLETRAHQADSLLCIGLDPHPQDLPVHTPEAAAEFCERLISAAADQAAAFKPNSAFFEAFGSAGMAVLQQVIAEIPQGIPVILDAKRADIASTGEAYAHAAFQVLGADALTASPYLGFDALAPFLEDEQHGVFLLCKTSNPGSADLQDLAVLPAQDEPGDQILPLYEYLARQAQARNTKDNLGLVVGANYPQTLAGVRAAAPDLWILAPGVGAQGADLQAALQAGLRRDGSGLLIPVSRAISRAADARRAASELRQEINAARQKIQSSPALKPAARNAQLSELAEALLQSECVRFGQFTLKSGLQSPIYLDLRRLVGYPEILRQVARSYLPILTRLPFTRLAALPYAALPIATAISMLGNWPLVYPRKEAKTYGTKAEVEGVYAAGEKVVVIDDLATTGSSKFEAIEKLTAAGLQVSDVVVLIDRQSGAKEALAQAGYRLHAVCTLAQLLDIWESSGRIPAEQIAATRQFLKETSGDNG